MQLQDFPFYLVREYQGRYLSVYSCYLLAPCVEILLIPIDRSWELQCLTKLRASVAIPIFAFTV